MIKQAFSVQEFCDAYSVGKTLVYAEMNAGRLKAKKIGRRTVIPFQSGQDWLAACASHSASAAA